MNTKKRNLLIITLILVVFTATYFIHLNKLSNSKISLKNREKVAEQKFNETKKKIRTEFTRDNESESYLFDQLFNFDKAISFKDSTISFFVYSDHIEVRLLDEKYLGRLHSKVKSEAINKRTDVAHDKQVFELSKKHGATVQYWVSRISNDMFFDYFKQDECKPYFDNNNYYTIDPLAFSEFDRFLTAFKMCEEKVSLQNEIIIRNYQAELNNLKKGLSQDARGVMEQNLNDQSALKSVDESFTFNWSGFGNFNYSIPVKEIDHDYIDDAMNEVYAEQYKDYSLQNGAMPYGYCFVTSNYGSSGIE